MFILDFSLYWLSVCPISMLVDSALITVDLEYF